MRPKIDELIKQIGALDGNVAAVARHYGASRTTIYSWIKRSARAEQALDEARENFLDEAESVLFRKVREGSTPELIFFLKTQGKARGYSERSVISGDPENPLRVFGLRADDLSAELGQVVADTVKAAGLAAAGWNPAEDDREDL